MGNVVLGIGYALTGVGILIEAGKAAKSGRAPALPPPNGVSGARGGPGRGPLRGASPLPAPGSRVHGMQVHRIRSIIDDGVPYLRREIIRGSTSPRVIEAARGFVSRKCPASGGGKRWCIAPKDAWGEVTAVFDALADPNHEFGFRYVRDPQPPTEEGARAVGLSVVISDVFATAEASLRSKAGDCDEAFALLGALLMSIGYRVRIRIIRTTDARTWSHVYLLVGLPPGGDPKRWVPLDLTVQKPAGWEVEGAAEVARTGRASGYVAQLRDFDV